MLRFVSLMETYLCSVSSFIRKLNAADPELRRMYSLHDLNITQSMAEDKSLKSSKNQICILYRNISINTSVCTIAKTNNVFVFYLNNHVLKTSSFYDLCSCEILLGTL